MSVAQRDHAPETRGQKGGHLLRRLIHLSMALIPFVYYRQGASLANLFSLEPQWLVLLVMLCALGFEALRLQRGWLLLGQRSYEAKRFSAFAWTALSLGLVLLLAPGGYPDNQHYAIPIILSCAFGDPLLGEARRAKLSVLATVLLGLCVLYAVWLVSVYFLNTAWYFALMLPPVILLAEWPSWRWIDDNASMMLAPLFLLIIITWFL